jgi:hypothetical protein
VLRPLPPGQAAGASSAAAEQQEQPKPAWAKAVKGVPVAAGGGGAAAAGPQGGPKAGGQLAKARKSAGFQQGGPTGAGGQKGAGRQQARDKGGRQQGRDSAAAPRAGAVDAEASSDDWSGSQRDEPSTPTAAAAAAAAAATATATASSSSRPGTPASPGSCTSGASGGAPLHALLTSRLQAEEDDEDQAAAAAQTPGSTIAASSLQVGRRPAARARLLGAAQPRAPPAAAGGGPLHPGPALTRPPARPRARPQEQHSDSKLSSTSSAGGGWSLWGGSNGLLDAAQSSIALIARETALGSPAHGGYGLLPGPGSEAGLLGGSPAGYYLCGSPYAAVQEDGAGGYGLGLGVGLGGQQAAAGPAQLGGWVESPGEGYPAQQQQGDYCYYYEQGDGLGYVQQLGFAAATPPGAARGSASLMPPQQALGQAEGQGAAAGGAGLQLEMPLLQREWKLGVGLTDSSPVLKVHESPRGQGGLLGGQPQQQAAAAAPELLLGSLGGLLSQPGYQAGAGPPLQLQLQLQGSVPASPRACQLMMPGSPAAGALLSPGGGGGGGGGRQLQLPAWQQEPALQQGHGQQLSPVAFAQRQQQQQQALAQQATYDECSTPLRTRLLGDLGADFYGQQQAYGGHQQQAAEAAQQGLDAAGVLMGALGRYAGHLHQQHHHQQHDPLSSPPAVQLGQGRC